MSELLGSNNIKNALEMWGIPIVYVHTKDFVYATIACEERVEKVLEGMRCGVRVASFLASHGALDNFKPDISIPPSKKGVELAHRMGGDEDGAVLYGDVIECVVPSLLVDKPKTTVGLGDAFTGGYIH